MKITEYMIRAAAEVLYNDPVLDMSHNHAEDLAEEMLKAALLQEHAARMNEIRLRLLSGS